MAQRIHPDRTIRSVLSELSGAKDAGQKLTKNSFHPFPARMPLSVAKRLLEGAARPGAVVLDPMTGSGTTMIAARELGLQGIGLDRDPLAVLLARTAAQVHEKAVLEQASARILERARRALRSPERTLSEARASLPDEDQQFVQYWFSPTAQKQLFALVRSIKREPPGPGRDLAWVVFSSLIIAKSAGASFALDISRSRPHKSLEKSVVLPFDGWPLRFKAAMDRLPFLGRVPGPACRIQLGDARWMPLGDESVDIVLTSPPYLNAIDYLRTHKFSLVWMGHELEDLRELRGTMVGTERGLWERDGLPEPVEARLESAISEARRRATVRKYLSDLGKILGEVSRVLRAGGVAYLVLGPTIIATKRTDAARLMGEIGESVGLSPIAGVVRNLPSVRRSLPPPSLAVKNDMGLRMRREVIVALRKRP